MRCAWANTDDELMIAYHDYEYGTKRSGSSAYFEVVVLEFFQAGLSWRTILHKRENFRRAFHQFDVEKIAAMDDTDVMRLLEDKSIIRNRRKIEAAIKNAKIALEIEKEQGFDAFIDSFKTPLALSKALKKKGFSFVGETICSEIMMCLGLIPSHEETCFRYHES